MSKVLELFGLALGANANWHDVVQDQRCPYLKKTCIKNRKSQPEIAIGTCSVKYSDYSQGIIICPHRLLEGQQVFVDCLHLLTRHEPGNELHIVPEVSIPGGSVDYVLVSARDRKVADFVGIELQTLDTTGSVWSERQAFLRERGVNVPPENTKTFGMNWKMTAKTILVQLHHKLETFEHLGKHLVLVIQTPLEAYMRREFSFDHVKTANLADSLHVHSYDLKLEGQVRRIQLENRLSTDVAGIALALGLQAEARVELDVLLKRLEGKLSNQTRFQF
jgi:Restriction endonuclease NotI